MDEYLAQLKSQFDGDDGSFIIRLRCDYEWDKNAFTKLIEAMRICCERTANDDKLDRWLADGFWYFAIMVRAIASHSEFRRIYPQEYYDYAFRRLEDLADWFFTGQRPYLEGKGFDPM